MKRPFLLPSTKPCYTMLIDFIIVISYFALVMIFAMRGKVGKDANVEEYFLSSRNLRWPSIAISTIATNISGYQLLGMMGSAYLYGLAQANFEINAIQGLFMAAFIFVPMYLKDRVITITQFIEKRLGKEVALIYSVANLLLFSTIILGAALYWGSYAANFVFGDLLGFISDDPTNRMIAIIIFLGVFSAIYTYFGGLGAVVKTDIIQFVILLSGGIMLLVVSVQALGGWGQLYTKTPELMHLHLPADHPKLPWIGMIGLLFMNINYWCANQSVVQRSLAARSLEDAQIGLMVGGLMKYLMAAIIIIPGIALAGITEGSLADPDQAFPHLVVNYLPTGVRAIILCAVFAGLMSTVDSVFNSLSTLFSIDIYKRYLRPDATDQEVVSAGRNTILVTLVTGILMGCYILHIKNSDPTAAFTHTLNEIRYYFNTGFVVVICASAFLIAKNRWITLAAFLSTGVFYSILLRAVDGINYLVAAMIAILIGYAILAIPSIAANGHRPMKEWLQFSSPRVRDFGLAMLASLIICHIIFH